MNYKAKTKSNHEIVHPIVIWIIASIIFHLLLALGIITLKMSSIPLTSPKNITAQDRAILMMDEPKQPTPPATALPKMEKKAPVAEKDIPKFSDYTLIPGRQGINKQNIDDPRNLTNLPKPQDQILEKKAKTPEALKEASKKFEAEKKEEKLKELDSSLHQEMTQDASKEIKKDPASIIAQDRTNQSNPTMDKKIDRQDNAIPFLDQAPQKPAEILKQKVVEKSNMTPQDLPSSNTAKSENASKPLRKKSFPSEQNPYEFVPQPSRIISFQDLNLGFDNNYATIGNNANLIQQGITSAAPDDVSLKHLTYYNQCAGMMKTAFATHPQTRLRQNATGKRFRFDLVVDRQGNQLQLNVIQGSGDMILDRIIQESIASIKMFPKVPSFITDSPFTMRWTFLH